MIVLLNNQWVKDEVSNEKKNIELNENEDTAYQNVWGMAEER